MSERVSKVTAESVRSPSIRGSPSLVEKCFLWARLSNCSGLIRGMRLRWEGVLEKEDCPRALSSSSSSSNGRAALSQHLMGNERTTTKRTGAGFSFCCLWKAAPFLSDLSAD